MMEKVVQSPYWRESLHIAALITLMRNPSPYPSILANSNLFQPNAQVSAAALLMLLCVNLLKSPSLARVMRYIPTPSGNWKRSTVTQRFCRWLVKRLSGITVFLRLYLVACWWYTPRQRWEPTPISWFLGTLQQADIMQDISTHHLQSQWTAVDLSASQWSREISLGLFNRFIHNSITRTTLWHLSIGLKQTRVCENAKVWV